METKTTALKKRGLNLLKKFGSIIFFLLVFYVAPLSFRPALLLNWRVIFLAAIFILMYATQPRVSIKEAQEKKATDKSTMLLIVIVSGIGQIIALLEWAYFNKTEPAFSKWTFVGALLLIAGTSFRLYAIYTLGKYFTSTVQIKDGHKIINTGPYKFLRHPSYTGAFTAMLGCAVFLHSFLGIIIFGIAMLFVYRLRIQTEEKTLLQNFGAAYSNYCRHTWKMFPWIW